ncbi:Yip1 family protein [Viridibacillus arvi]|uniref:Yip1 family protein n=1 Tax=Viridibacillus arvi TaxID=263475 RepID=UPI00187B8DCF|nr:Yip1 family protein [Viridibacillus sp. JNUCC-6]QOV13023.1 YIP1 family protein [Viridibacillus sp. JNUCC-6]
MNELQETKQQEMLHPFFSIWLHPKKTARYILDHKGLGYAIIFILLGGMAGVLFSAMDAESLDIPTWGILLICLIGGPFIGLFSSTIGAGVFLLIGKLFKGKATYKEMFKVMGLSSIPHIWLAPILLLWMAFSPETFFRMDSDYLEVKNLLVTLISSLVSLCVTIWSFVINVAVIAETHRFSNWRAFFTIFIPGFVVFAILLIIVIIFTFSIMG